MVEMEMWLFAVVIALILVLILMLWSAMRGRKVHLTVTSIDTLREGLPSIVGATHGTLLDGNRIEVLQNGDGFFPRGCSPTSRPPRRPSISRPTSGGRATICRKFAEALAAKARAGVEVRVLLDASGSARMDDELLKLMRDAGCKVVKYQPFRFSNLARVNSRDHRKIAGARRPRRLRLRPRHRRRVDWATARIANTGATPAPGSRGRSSAHAAVGVHRELGGGDRRGARRRQVLSQARRRWAPARRTSPTTSSTAACRRSTSSTGWRSPRRRRSC